jgi:hypothetical protein
MPELFAHPADERSGRFVCSPEHPMPADRPKGSRWVHLNVVEVGEQRDGYPGGDWQDYQCKDCGHRWGAELPQ